MALGYLIQNSFKLSLVHSAETMKRPSLWRVRGATQAKRRRDRRRWLSICSFKPQVDMKEAQPDTASRRTFGNSLSVRCVTKSTPNRYDRMYWIGAACRDELSASWVKSEEDKSPCETQLQPQPALLAGAYRWRTCSAAVVVTACSGNATRTHAVQQCLLREMICDGRLFSINHLPSRHCRICLHA